MPITVTAAAVPVALSVLFTLAIVYASFLKGLPGSGATPLTLGNYVEVYTSSSFYRLMGDTLEFGVVAVLVALAFGLPLAWLTERTDLGHKNIIYAAMNAALVIPGTFSAIGWLLLFHPRIGLASRWIDQLAHLPVGSVSVATIRGMGVVQGIIIAPLVFVLTVAEFAALDGQLEDAARVHGMSAWAIVRRVTLPLMAPAVVAASIFTFVISYASFDVPGVIGLTNRVNTFSAYLYLVMNPEAGFPRYGVAGAASMAAIAVSILLTMWYWRTIRSGHRFRVVTGRGYRPVATRLGRGRPWAVAFVLLYIALAEGMPVLFTLWTAFVPYFQAPSLSGLQHLTLANFSGLPWGLVWSGARNTALVMVVVPALTLTFGFLCAWITVRSTVRFKALFDMFTFLPQAIPGIVFGLGAVLVALLVSHGALHLYGSVWLYVVVYAVVFLAFSVRSIANAMLQVDPDLERAGMVSGMSLFQVFRRILVPLTAPALRAIWLWVALLCFRELTIATMLFTPRDVTLPVVLWDIWSGGELTQAAALNVLIIAVALPLMWLYWRLNRRGGTAA